MRLLVKDPCSLWDILEGNIRYFDTYYRNDNGVRKVKQRVDRMTEISRFLKEERGFPPYYSNFGAGHDLPGSAPRSIEADGDPTSTPTHSAEAGDDLTISSPHSAETGDGPAGPITPGAETKAGNDLPGSAPRSTEAGDNRSSPAPPSFETKGGADSFCGDIVPYLFPETKRMFSLREQRLYFTEENQVFESSKGETVEGAGIFWQTAYSEKILPEQYVRLRDSGTLWRDYEEASHLFYTLYNLNHAVNERIRDITIIRLQ
jgi:hypothetical protein